MRISTIAFLACFITLSIQAQVATRIVRGTLTDPTTGWPMPGVNIVIKGTTTGTTTDVNGNYEIEAPVSSTLVFSFIGYASKEMVVTPLQPEGSEKAKESQKIFRHKIPESKERTLSPYFFVKSDDPSVDQLPLKSTSASVNISGVIADVRVRQVYVNTGKNSLEAIYIFPGSTKAAVYAMTMTIGERKLMARIKEKEKARSEYEQAKQEGKTATLLEQNRPNVFQMNAANILPGDTIVVDLYYTELLVPLEGTYEFVYPTVVGPRYSETPDDDLHANETWIENPYHHSGKKPDYIFELKTTLNTGIPIQTVTSTSHQVNVQFQNKNRALIQLDESESLGGNRDFILKYRLRGGEVESGMLLHPRADENFFLLMIEPPDAPKPEQIPPREYIFIVDVSGSMFGFPLEVSKRLLRNLISNLRPVDRFNVMLFESSNQMLHERSVPATNFNINEAIRIIDRQRGGGGTRLYPALQKALAFKTDEDVSRIFIVVTDGYVTVEKEAFSLVRKNLNKANLFAFGIGSSVNRYLIEGLAHAGMGEPFIVTNEDEAERIGKKFKTYIERPVLTNIKIDYGNFKVYDVEPLSIPDVFAERPVIVYGKYKGEPFGTITLSGYSGNKTYSKRINLQTAIQENNEALRYLWARSKIKYLNDYAGYYEDDHNYYHVSGKTEASAKRVEAVTQLGIKYNLLTQYTSFIAVDSLIRNPSGQNEKVKQPLPMPQGVSNLAIAIRGMSLTPDVQQLSELVVTGYGMAASTQTLSCSAVSISAEETFTESSNLTEALQGRVAGVTITQNAGTPGGSASVRIRGHASLTPNNSPLYIIDGVPLDNTDHPMATAGVDMPDRLSEINPNDVESVNVLKPTSATAIYGSRGANGVILITTKKPKTDRHEIAFSSSASMEKVNKLPELQNAYAQGRPVQGNPEWQGPDAQEMLSWGPSLKDLMYDGSEYDYDRNKKMIAIEPGKVSARPYNRYDFFRTGFTLNNHLQIGRSKQRSKYLIAAGDTRQESIIPGTDFRRTTSRLLLERKFFNTITLGSNTLISTSRSHLVQRGSSASSVMFGLLTTPPSFDNANGFSAKKASGNVSAYQLPDLTQRSFSGGLIDNPYWSISKNVYKGVVNRINPSVYAETNVTDWLSLKYQVSADVYQDMQRSGFDVYAAASPSGEFTDRNEKFRSLNSDLLVTGQRYLLNDRISATAVVGVSSFWAERVISRTDGLGLLAPGKFNTANAIVSQRYRQVYDQNNTRLFSNVKFSYQQMVSFDLTLSREKTSTLPDKSNHLHSEGAGLSFVFTELPFLSYSDFNNVLNFGKLFINTGRTQKEAPLFLDPNYHSASTLDLTDTEFYPERIHVRTNRNLKAEQTSSFEAGTSLNFLSSRINLNAAYYSNTSANTFIPVLDNGTATLRNGGRIDNTGVELTLETTPVNQNVRWNIAVNFTRYRSIVKTLPGGIDRVALAGFTSVSSSLIAGQPYGVLFGTRYLRNEKGELVIGVDGFPLVDATPGILGNPNPDWTMGINNTFTIKGVSLSFLFDVKSGGAVWNGTMNTLNYFGTSKITGTQRQITNYIFEGVTEEGNRNITPVTYADPAKDMNENRWVRYGRGGVAEDAIEDGSWVRLRQVSLSYKLPQNLVFNLRVRRASVSVFAENLLLFTKYSGIDPETNLTGNSNGRGLDYFNLPNYKRYGVSLKVGL